MGAPYQKANSLIIFHFGRDHFISPMGIPQTGMWNVIDPFLQWNIFYVSEMRKCFLISYLFATVYINLSI